MKTYFIKRVQIQHKRNPRVVYLLLTPKRDFLHIGASIPEIMQWVDILWIDRRKVCFEYY